MRAERDTVHDAVRKLLRRIVDNDSVFEYFIDSAVSVESVRVEIRQFPLFEENLAAGVAKVP